MRIGPIAGTVCLALLSLHFPAFGQQEGKPPIEQYVEMLRGENAPGRRAASRVLCLLPLRVPEMKDALVAGLEDDDAVVALRCRATLALWEQSRNDRHRELRDMLLAKDADSRVKAARQLRKAGADAAPAVAELVTALGSPERAPREAAAATLDAIGAAAEHAVPALITLYPVTQGSYVVTQALEGIHRGLLRATPLLLAELADPMTSARQAALDRLARNGPAGSKVTEAVRAAYEDPRTRVSAVYALADVAPEDPRTLDLLKEALTDGNDRVRELAVRSLGELGLLAEHAAPALVERLEDMSPVVRTRAADALGLIGVRTDAAVAALVRALGEKDGRVVHAASRSLARLGPPTTAVPRLTELTKSEKSWERAWAMAAVWQALPRGDRSAALTIAVATDWEVSEFREEALAALRGMAGGPRSAELVEHFCTGYPEPLGSALSAMPAGAPGPGELSALLRAAEAPEGSGYSYAFDRIAAYGPRAAPAVGALVALLLGDDADRSALAARALGAIGPDAAKYALPALLAVMAKGDCREAAADALAKMGPLIRPLLVEILRTGKPEGAAPFAARALGGMGRHGFPAAPILLARARAGDLACVEALGRLAPLGDHDATNRVVRALALLLDASDEEFTFFPEKNRVIAARAFRIAIVRCFGEIGYDAGQGAGALVRLLGSDDDLLRVEAAAAIKRIAGVMAHSDPILDVLIEAAKRREEDPGDFYSLWNHSRWVAIEALGELGARRATPLLYRILEDETESTSVRVAAHAALAKIWGE